MPFLKEFFMTGADVLIRDLKEAGVPCIYTLCGNGLEPILTACRRGGMRVIDTRNEQAAAYMADTAGRLTRRPGVVATSSGVAHLNALTGVCNAWFDGSPMLLITGATDSATAGRGNFQDMDSVALSRPICKYAQGVNRVERISPDVREALRIALTGRPGPVHLTIPMDVLRAETRPPSGAGRKTPPLVYRYRTAADLGAVQEAAELLRKAKRPLLVAGSGAFYANAAQELARLARLLKAPVTVPIWDRGAVEEPIPEFVGVIGSASGEPRLLPDADLVILAGARVDYRLGYLEPPAVSKTARIIRIDPDPLEIVQGIHPDVSLSGEVKTVFSQLIRALHSKGHLAPSAWLAEARKRDRAFRKKWMASRPQPAMPPTGRHIVEALRGVVDKNTFFLVDGGNIGQWVHMAMADRYPERWITCGASGVIGWGIPGAMAVRSLYPEEPILVLSGDGSATFTIAELETATRQGLPFVCVVADDRAWGIVVSNMRKMGKPMVGAKLGPIRFDQVAQGFGACGLRIEDPRELPQAIREGFRADRPTLIHVPIRIGGPSD
jgi:acetolactate synthase-1/2/3 large subunit